MPITSRIASAAARGFGLFSLVAAVKDAYFNYVTLLLPGNGTNGAQNNTFLDSSTNNFTITRNGNTTQGTFAPYGANWSNYFGGSGDYINFASSSALSFASDFTVEAWVYNNYSTGTFNPAVLYDSSSNAISSFEINNGTNYPSVAGITATNTVTRYTFSTGPSVPVLQWVHVAWVRSSGTVKVYVNGTASTSTLSNSAATGQIVQVANGRTSGSPWNGYISNLRITSSAVYTSNFTPSTVPLTAISGTQLLTCQSNRFRDNSSNALSFTTTGSPTVQVFSPFSPTAAYSAGTIGGSGYFDGSGDYLLGPANSTPLSFGTGDFTIESWVYPTSFTNANSTIFSAYGSTTGAYILYLPSSGYPNFYVYSSGGLNGNVFSNPSSKLTLTAWNHVAVTRASGVFRLFINGVVIDSFTNTTANINATTSNNSAIGAYFQAGMSLETTSPINGYLTDVRVVKGTAVYTAAFTPPTAPLTAITNTQLLLSSTNAGVIDNAMMNNLETVGNAQISTTQSKFGGSSIYLDGTGDWLLTKTSPNLDMGTGDLTVEGWFYLTATVAVDYRMIVSDASSGNNYICIRSGGTGGQLEVNVNGTSFRLNLNNSVTINTWFHLAVVRSGSTWYGFINGTSLGTSTSAAAFNLGNGGMYVGRFGGATAYEWPGYIDDLRITKGYARYTANFTAPTAAFPLQ